MDENEVNHTDEKPLEEDDAMSKLSEYIKNNKELVYSFATKNTPINKDGRAVITKDDVWRKETEDDTMNATVEKSGYKRLDISKLNFSDKLVTAKDSLRDVIPFNWSENVLQGNKKVVIQKTEDN